MAGNTTSLQQRRILAARRGDFRAVTFGSRSADRDKNDFVLIDIETGAYEVDADEQELHPSVSVRGCRKRKIWMRRGRLPVTPTASADGSSADDLMIRGMVTAEREAIIQVSLRGPTGRVLHVEARCGTPAFSGHLSLPPRRRCPVYAFGGIER